MKSANPGFDAQMVDITEMNFSLDVKVDDVNTVDGQTSLGYSMSGNNSFGQDKQVITKLTSTGASHLLFPYQD